MTHLDVKSHGGERKLSSGNLSSFSSSSSCMDFKSSTCSTSSSIPSHLSSTSSIDSALIWLYTSCEFKNLPYKPLNSAPTGSPVVSLCLTNNLLIAGTANNGLQVFHVNNNLQAFQLENSTSSAGSLKAILSSQNQIFTCHQNGSIRLWNPDDLKKPRGSLPTKTDTLARCLIPANYIQVRRHRKILWIRHADAVSSIAATGRFIYSGSWDKTLKIWRASDLKCLESVKAHDDAVNAVAAHEQFVYTAGADGKIKAWEVSAGDLSFSDSAAPASRKKKARLVTLVAVLERHSSSVNALALDSASGYLYSASSDMSIGVWEREETAMHMAAVESLRGHCMAVLSLAVCNVPDKDGGSSRSVLCSGSADKTVRVWSRERVSGVHSCLCVIRGHQGPVKSVGISSTGLRDGALVWSGGLDSHVRTWLVSLDGSEQSAEDSKIVED